MAETMTTLKASELRVGNYILLTDIVVLPHPHKIRADDIADIANGRVALSAIEPIPLTSELLQKIGFSADTNELATYYYKGSRYTVAVYFDKNKLLIQEHHPANRMARGLDNIPMPYLHQLQNLYFILTGYELEINL